MIRNANEARNLNNLLNRIDHAHHGTQPHISLDETIEFERAIDLARRKLSDEDTLIVVSADHAHTMTYAGYGVTLTLSSLHANT